MKALSPMLSDRDKRLARLMRSYGYRVEVFATCVRLHVMADHLSSGYQLPYSFKSVNHAAEHLIPIIRDDSFRLACQAST